MSDKIQTDADKDAAKKAELADAVRVAIRAEQDYRTLKTTQEIDPATGRVVTEEERVKRAEQAAAQQRAPSAAQPSS
jgi:hypothetical protein